MDEAEVDMTDCQQCKVQQVHRGMVVSGSRARLRSCHVEAEKDGCTISGAKAAVATATDVARVNISMERCAVWSRRRFVCVLNLRLLLNAVMWLLILSIGLSRCTCVERVASGEHEGRIGRGKAEVSLLGVAHNEGFPTCACPPMAADTESCGTGVHSG